MADSGLSHARILEAAEQVLRRFGPTKATVVDVARALGVTHGSVYRYFADKAALRDAVVERWLAQIMPPLEAIASGEGSASARLHAWILALIAAKRERATKDPELFAAYVTLAREAREIVRAHVDHFVTQLARIVSDGIEQGEFAPTDPAAAGRGVLLATTRFHHPAHAAEWAEPGFDAEFEGVWSLLMDGFRARETPAAD